MQPDYDNLRLKYLSNGFIVVKSFFKQEYIKSLRDKMIQLSYKNHETSEILLDKDVQNLLLNKKLIKIVKEVLNTNEIMYYSDSSINNHPDPFKSKNGFHNDARNEDSKIPFDQEYPIVRVGIYFENFKDFSGGLKIKKGSHKTFCFTTRTFIESTKELLKFFDSNSRYQVKHLKLCKSINLELEEGDVIIWNLRTHHCGMSRRLKLFSKLCLQPNFEKIFPRFLFLPTQYKKDRCSMFATFAKNDLNDKNILGYIKLKMIEDRLKKIKLDKDLMKYLNEIDCKLPDKNYFLDN